MQSAPYAETGRTLSTPVEDLIELHHEGQAALAIAARAPYREPGVVDEVLTTGAHFLRNPMVAGLVELDGWKPREHRLIYPTGRVFPLGQILARAGDAGLGLRAGLELAYRGALLLQESSAAGEASDLPVHGHPGPWRWLFDLDGELHLIGWGFPALELYQLDDDPETLLPTDSYRYLPPERLRGEPEDLSSDLFTLGLLSAQAILGQPLYDGTTHAVRAQAERAEGERLLYGFRDALTIDLQRFFGRALDPYRDGRHPDVEDFIRQAHDLLYGPLTEGPTLAERVRALAPELPPLPVPHAQGGAQRWRPVRRSDRARGVGERAVVDVAVPEPDAVWSMQAEQRRSEHPRDPAEARRRALRQSQHDRDARLRDRLGSRSSAPRPALRDRTGLFPSLPLGADALRYLIEPPEGRSVWARLCPTETLACSAARVIDQCRHTPIGPTGQLEGWYRLTQHGEAWFGCTETRILDAAEPVQLEFIENRTVAVQISLHADEPPIDLEIGTAVHARFLVDYLRERFELRARDWRLFCDQERPIDDWQVLDDFEPAPGALLHLRRTRAAPRARRRR